MIKTETKLKVADNSGANIVQCIHINGSTGIKTATVGSLITVSVKSAEPNSKVKKGEIHLAVVVRTTKPSQREDGFFVRFDDNAVVLLDKKSHDPIGSRVLGPVVREVRAVSLKVVSLANEVF